MKTQKLVYIVIAIFVVAFISYKVFSPSNSNTKNGEEYNYQETEENEPLDNDDDENIADNTNNTTNTENKTQTTTQNTTKTTTTTQTDTSKYYTLAEVATHNTETSCFTVIRGNVYDITSYIPKHPGGKNAVMNICGKDGSAVFETKHGDNPKQNDILVNFLTGKLK